jgi:hypothetical protein
MSAKTDAEVAAKAEQTRGHAPKVDRPDSVF